MRPRHAYPLCFSVLIAVCAFSAPAQPEPEFGAIEIETVPETDEEVVRELVDRLDDDDWLRRDLATIELGELDRGISLEMIEKQLGRTGLSPEQRARLQLAAIRRFALRPKGALGVSFGTTRIGAIEVQPIPANDEFPASKVLRPDDQIAMVGDRIIDGSFSLRVEILSREPGDTLPVTLVRAGRVMHLDLVLGSFDDLTGAVRMDSQLLSNALNLRWERMGREAYTPGSIGGAITTDEWARAAFPDDAAPDPREPGLHAPKGWVVGEGLRVNLGNNAWTASTINVWASAEALDEATTMRGMVLAGDRIQPMVALRLLIEREREQIIEQLESADDDKRPGLITSLDILTGRLDALSEKIERTRPSGEP